MSMFSNIWSKYSKYIIGAGAASASLAILCKVKKVLFSAGTFSSAIVKSKDGRPLRVVVTGARTGLGYALAKQFLQCGDQVAICSRSNVDETVTLLKRETNVRTHGSSS